MQELIKKVQRKDVVIIERKEITAQMGGVVAFSDNDTMDTFLEKLANSLAQIEKMGGMVPGDIQIMTDGKNIAAKMVMGR